MLRQKEVLRGEKDLGSFLSIPLLLLFWAALLSKDLAQEVAMPGLDVAALEGVGLTKGPYSLKI